MTKAGAYPQFAPETGFVRSQPWHELPAILVRVGGDRLLLSIADGLDGIGAYAALDQRLLGRVGPTFTQRQVVFGGTAFVTVAFDLDFPTVLLDGLRSLGQRLLRVSAQIGFVIVEVNVFDHLGKELFVSKGRRGGRRRCWCRRRHCH